VDDSPYQSPREMPRLDEPFADRRLSQRERLSLPGWLLTIALYVIGLVPFVYVGWVAGIIIGFTLAEPELNAPPGGGVGMAPDLAPVGRAGVIIALSFFGGIAGGLIVGMIIMALVCRYPLFWLFRRIPGLTVNDAAG
jgi:hypothetical protein